MDWDEKYGDEPLWSGRPNGVLVGELVAHAAGQPAGHVPGTALDVGCGEGADAAWLASRGWQVTGIDVSRVALDRAAAAGLRAGVGIRWLCADLVDLPDEGATYDLVTLHYPALARTADDRAITALLDLVSPGGTLLVVGHAPMSAEHARSHGFELADRVQVDDVRAALDEGWDIVVDETRPRVDPPHEGSPFTHDAVLRARRRG